MTRSMTAELFRRRRHRHRYNYTTQNYDGFKSPPGPDCHTEYIITYSAGFRFFFFLTLMV